MNWKFLIGHVNMTIMIHPSDKMIGNIKNMHWNRNIFILLKCCHWLHHSVTGAACNENLVKIMTFLFQYGQYGKIYFCEIWISAYFLLFFLRPTVLEIGLREAIVRMSWRPSSAKVLCMASQTDISPCRVSPPQTQVNTIYIYTYRVCHCGTVNILPNFHHTHCIVHLRGVPDITSRSIFVTLQLPNKRSGPPFTNMV